MMYYKIEGSELWLGPVTIVFQDENVLFVRHGGIFVKVLPNLLSRTHECVAVV